MLPVPRRPIAVLVGAALTLGLSACSATNPITTMGSYEASDGVGVRLDDLRLGNLIVLSSDEGAPGVLIGHVTNDGARPLAVVLRIEPAEGSDGDVADSDPITVEPGRTVLLNPTDGEHVALDSVPARPGAYVRLQVVTERGSTSAQVPVLDGTLPEYADLVPDAATQEPGDDEAAQLEEAEAEAARADAAEAESTED